MSKIQTISVITPHYKSKTLFDTIDSVLCQTYPSIQYVLVVDGTEGYSVEEIRQYLHKKAPSRVHWQVIGLPENKGTVYALNTALSAVYGVYIFNLADDDVFTGPEILKEWTAYMLQNQAEICTARRQIISSKGVDKVRVEPCENEIVKILTYTPQELFDDLAVCNYIFGSSTAQSMTAFEKYGLYDVRYRLTEDYPRVMKLLRNGVKIYFFPKEVVCCQSEGVSSPGRILSLMDENESIFSAEIYPYCSAQWNIKIKHGLWKIKTIRYGKFLARYARANTLCQKFGLLAMYPENLIRYIKKLGG